MVWQVRREGNSEQRWRQMMGIGSILEVELIKPVGLDGGLDLAGKGKRGIKGLGWNS